MRKSVMYLLCLCAFGLIAAGTAKADTIFTLNVDGCSRGCGTGPYGTIDLAQSGSNVIVTETLASGYLFANTGAGNALEFDISGGSESNITNISSGFSDATLPSHSLLYHASAFGYFPEAVACSSCGSGTSAPQYFGPLTFTVDGVTIADFIANKDVYYFAADIGELSDGTVIATGNVGSNTPPNTPVIPEPPSLLLLGTGLLLLSGAFKAKHLVAPSVLGNTVT